MALKNLKSKFDLVSGEAPVGNMMDQSGPISQLPIDEASQKHIDSLQEIPNQSPFQDLDGAPGPSFDNGIDSNLHEDSLVNIYQSTINIESSYGNGQPGAIWPAVGPGTYDLNGAGVINEATFDNGPNSDLHVNLLENAYTSNINTGASYGQGQPGAIWPSINAGASDLNGAIPNNGEYLNNLPI